MRRAEDVQRRTGDRILEGLLLGRANGGGSSEVRAARRRLGRCAEREVPHLVAEQVGAVDLVGHDGANLVVESFEQARVEGSHHRGPGRTSRERSPAHDGVSPRGGRRKPGDVGRDVSGDLGAKG